MINPLTLAPDPGVQHLNERFLSAPSNILDAGAGRGRNAFYLATQGHNVVAIEQDEEYIAQMKLAKSLGSTSLSLEVAKDDVCAPSKPSTPYDAVFVTKVLQELPSKSAASVALGALKNITRAGGLHIVTAYVGSKEDQDTMSHRVIFDPDEIQTMYEDSGWKILHTNSNHEPLVTIGGSPVIKSYDEIVAQKPTYQPQTAPNPLSQGMSDEYWRMADPELYDLIQSSRAA